MDWVSRKDPNHSASGFNEAISSFPPAIAPVATKSRYRPMTERQYKPVGYFKVLLVSTCVQECYRSLPKSPRSDPQGSEEGDHTG